MPDSPAPSTPGLVARAPTLSELATGLADGRFSAAGLVAAARRRAAEPDVAGPAIFPYGLDPAAPARAEGWDASRRAGAVPRCAGIPITIKDNIAQAGQPLRAGSAFLTADDPAPTDALVLARLDATGFVTVGRTNMTELAFSGLGLNPHYGTPINPAAPDRAPGGSSAGAAASVASGIVPAAIGTDTSGSCRIPAAFCGLVGFKPTARRVPLAGIYPLAPSLDSVGVIARSVTCCDMLDAAMTGRLTPGPAAETPAAPTFADLFPALREGTAPAVAAAYAAAIARLRAAGITIKPVDMDLLPRVSAINRDGGFGAVELHAHLRDRLPGAAARIDQRVLRRVMKGAAVPAVRVDEMRAQRAALIAWMDARLDGYSAVLMPTVASTAPLLADLRRDDDYDRINLLALRNAGIVNLLDRCAVTIPCQARGDLPVGFTLMAPHGADRALLSVAASLEAVIRGDHHHL